VIIQTEGSDCILKAELIKKQLTKVTLVNFDRKKERILRTGGESVYRSGPIRIVQKGESLGVKKGTMRRVPTGFLTGTRRKESPLGMDDWEENGWPAPKKTLLLPKFGEGVDGRQELSSPVKKEEEAQKRKKGESLEASDFAILKIGRKKRGRV